MAKFVIECPSCGRYNEASSSFFAKKKINCICGNIINIRSDKLKSKECPSCGNTIILDQSLGDKAVCPVCKHLINTLEEQVVKVEIPCPNCNCLVSVNKELAHYNCPLCDTEIDVQSQIIKERTKNNNQPMVIKFEGDNNTIIYKHPIEDFNYGSVLIVHESQEAFLIKNGIICNQFTSGRYFLNQDVLSKDLNDSKANLEGIVHSEVYFVNKVTYMGIKWGTDSKIRLFDPASNIHVEIGAYGQFNIQVVNARNVFLKLVGTTNKLIQNAAANDGLEPNLMMGKFRALIMNKVKSNIAKIIKEKQINVLEIDSYIDEISTALMQVINESLVDYGLYMPNFYIMSIQTPDDDPNFKLLKSQFAERTLKLRNENIKKAEADAIRERRLVEARTEAELKILQAQAESEAYQLKAQAEANEMRMKGYTYQDETSRKFGMEALKANEKSGFLSDMAQIKYGMGVVDSLNRSMSLNNQLPWDCSCGKKGNTENFCDVCGKRRGENQLWKCSCGKENAGNFCSNCGAPKRVTNTWKCTCGRENTENFCPNCGSKKPI